MEMLKALVRSTPKEIHTVELDGKKFVFKCDVEQLRAGIESLRGKFDNSKNRYGYQPYRGNHEINLTEEEYQENIDKFINEFEKRLEYAHVEEVVKSAVKKKNGTFTKNRVYDGYVLRNAEDNGSGAVNIYIVKYKTIGDLEIVLELHYATEYLRDEY